MVDEKGALPLHEAITHKVGYFTDGVILGSAKFVDQVFTEHRAKLVETKSRRNTGARPMRLAKWGNLTTMRDLRLNVIGNPE